MGSAHAGTEYGPQWMKMPNLAAVSQAGTGRARSAQILRSTSFVMWSSPFLGAVADPTGHIDSSGVSSGARTCGRSEPGRLV